MIHTQSNVLIDRIAPSPTAVRNLLIVVGFGLFTAILAQLRVPLPYSPIPLTGQTFAVLLAGAVLGARRGFASQATYLALGAMGVPVFAGSVGGFPHLLGPSGGYLWSFPVAAGLLGWLVERGASRSVGRLALALFVCDLLMLAVGTTWLAILYQAPMGTVLRWGAYPFIVSDAVKIAAVGLTLPRLVARQNPTQL